MRSLFNVLKKYSRYEPAGGIFLMLSGVFAMIMANSPLSPYYAYLIDTPVVVIIGALEIKKPLLLWVNDGLMAVFFLLVGLELKREFLEGELSDRKNIIFPALGAMGGMIIPALIYYFFNHKDPNAIQGWAIPAATDIAFALGILSLLGSRVPISLKVFLTSLAIFDDLGAIIIIALFYTSKISLAALIVVSICVVLLFLINRSGVSAKRYYIYIGLVMWVAMLKSGVHATLAGVILAMFIPMRAEHDPSISPVKVLEHNLDDHVTWLILPLFAFCNAGINFSGIGVDQFLHNIPVGIALGLFVGKQVGVFGFCWLGVVMGLTKLPNQVSWSTLYGTAALCGVGFTMSLFIGALAFEQTGVNQFVDERLGIIAGSLASGMLGYLVLRACLPRQARTE